MKKEDSFEENVKSLEEVVKKLESGNLSLEESILEFENGINFSKIASKKLDEAEKKINILITSENGDLNEEEFQVEE